MIGVGADAGTVRLQGLYEGSESADLGCQGDTAPIVEAGSHLSLRGIGLPQLLQLLLERVERGQRLILAVHGFPTEEWPVCIDAFCMYG